MYEVRRLDKNCWQESIQQWIRHKDLGEKPYIPEGFIDFDGERYKVEVQDR